MASEKHPSPSFSRSRRWTIGAQVCFIVFVVLSVVGNALTKYTLEQISNEKERVFQRRAVTFEGERHFTSALLRVTNPKKLNAYFLEGHGEHSIMNTDANVGYTTFANIADQFD